jgi:hypothetical protein
MVAGLRLSAKASIQLHRSVSNLIIPRCQYARCAKLGRFEPKRDSKPSLNEA